jgi:hypothetical protein
MQVMARTMEDVRKEHGGEAEGALESTGIESYLNICIGSVAAGTKIMLDLGLAIVREIEMLPIWRYTQL